jgi:hypothetical protein
MQHSTDSPAQSHPAATASPHSTTQPSAQTGPSAAPDNSLLDRSCAWPVPRRIARCSSRKQSNVCRTQNIQKNKKSPMLALRLRLEVSYLHRRRTVAALVNNGPANSNHRKSTHAETPIYHLPCAPPQDSAARSHNSIARSHNSTARGHNSTARAKIPPPRLARSPPSQ